MPYYEGVYVVMSELPEVVYYLRCGIVEGGSLDPSTYTIYNADMIITTPGATVLIITSSGKHLMFSKVELEQIVNGEFSKVYNAVTEGGNKL